MISARSIFQPRNDLGQFVQGSVAPAVQASVLASLQLIQQTALERCPRDTGALADSITIEMGSSDKTAFGTVGPHMFYADFVEYGTGRRGDPTAPYGHVESWPGQVAQPYMRPALDENWDAVVEVFRGQIAAAIK
jgi:HK97 gp10 family phage protein